jgi:hypothetical protein
MIEREICMSREEGELELSSFPLSWFYWCERERERELGGGG